MKRHAGRKPFAGQPPRYVGPRRTDRPMRGRNVTQDRWSPSDGELDALFLAALREEER